MDRGLEITLSGPECPPFLVLLGGRTKHLRVQEEEEEEGNLVSEPSWAPWVHPAQLQSLVLQGPRTSLSNVSFSFGNPQLAIIVIS